MTINSPEPIEWIVLDKDASSIMLISKLALYSMQWATISSSNTSWQGSNVRYWLKNEFYTTAFTSFEQELITTTRGLDDYNPKTNFTDGSPTKDKVFILSIKETERYFPTESDREFERSKYIDTLKDKSWILALRSPGNDKGVRAYIRKGVIEYRLNYPFGSYSDDYCIRPVIWVKVSH